MIEYYVYTHHDPRDCSLLYVGSGTKGRAMETAANGCRLPEHSALLTSFQAEGFYWADWVTIVLTGLSKGAARKIERILIEDWKPRLNIIFNPANRRKHAPRLTPAQVETALAMRAAGRTYREIADTFGTGTKAIERIVKGPGYAKGAGYIPLAQRAANDNTPEQLTFAI